MPLQNQAFKNEKLSQGLVKNDRVNVKISVLLWAALLASHWLVAHETFLFAFVCHERRRVLAKRINISALPKIFGYQQVQAG